MVFSSDLYDSKNNWAWKTSNSSLTRLHFMDLKIIFDIHWESANYASSARQKMETSYSYHRNCVNRVAIVVARTHMCCYVLCLGQSQFVTCGPFDCVELCIYPDAIWNESSELYSFKCDWREQWPASQPACRQRRVTLETHKLNIDATYQYVHEGWCALLFIFRVCFFGCLVHCFSFQIAPQ